MKKTKKTKNVANEGIKRKSWGVPQTVASIVGGVAGVVGVTVFGVYLAGGFNEKIINPDSIYFVYDSENFNTSYSQYETCEDFEITIKAPNEGITKNQVTLSFDSSMPTVHSQGYISNSIISVPEIVTIGQPFKVSLVKGILKDDDGHEILDDNGSTIDWINGGITKLFAQSEFNEINVVSFQIAVDVPVYRTETLIVNSEGQITDKIVTGETFTVSTKYIPTSSQYMFSDYYKNREGQLVKNQSIGLNKAREKHSFYQAKNTSAVSHIYDDKYNMHFLAGSDPVDEIFISGYTYNNAKDEILFNEGIGQMQDAEYYNANLVNVSSLPDKVYSEASLSLREASIGRFEVSKTKINLNKDQETNVFMQQNIYQQNSDFIGAKIYSTSGTLLDGMLSNIVLNFECEGKDPTKGENAFLFVEGGEEIEIEGKKYFKPFIGDEEQIADLRYSYWKMKSILTKDIKVYVSLIINGESGIEFFKNGDTELRYELSLSVKEQVEEPLSWNDSDDINVLLSYNEDGTVAPHSINLSVLANVPENNKYKDPIFFAYFGERNDELANQIIGANSYDKQASGRYAVGADNLYLYAIDGDSINLYTTGEFKIYFGTTTGNYNLDGTFEMALICNQGINVVCQKSLYDDSVTSGELDTSNYEEEDETEVLINQGESLPIIATFKVKAESAPIFEEEFYKGKINLVVLDKFGNDISTLFVVENTIFTTDSETGEGILTYTLKINEIISIEEESGVYVGSLKLTYDEDVFVWTFDINKDVCIYDATTKEIYVDTDENYKFTNILNGTSSVFVEQTLNVEGGFDISIVCEDDEENERNYSTVEAFLVDIFGNESERIVLVDQKGRTDSLKGLWEFYCASGASSVVNITSGGQSFTFKEASSQEVTLGIRSKDRKKTTTEVLKFEVTSVGVQSIKYDNRTSIEEEEDLAETTEEISSVILSKYGAQGKVFDFAKQIKFFTDTDATQEYNKVYFSLSTAFISGSSLSDRMILDLFGEGGVITITLTDGNTLTDYDATSLRAKLINAKIASLTFNKDFAVTQTLRFIANDESGSVNTTIDLNILKNCEISEISYGNCYAESPIEILNSVSYMSGEESKNLIDFYSQAQGVYIVAVQDGFDVIYQIVEASEKPENAIATITRVEEQIDMETVISRGYVTFEDFWDEEEKTFAVHFRPEGNNYYTLDKLIEFNVKRNIEIQDLEKTYYILSEGGKISDYASITRKNGDNAINAEITYSFDEYLDLLYDEQTGISVIKKDDAFFDFAYNEQEIETNLRISIAGFEIGQLPIKIKPYTNGTTDDIYAVLAGLFSPTNDEEQYTQIRTFDDVEYMMVSKSYMSWKFTNLIGYTIQPSQIDNGNRLTFISVTNSIVTFRTVNPPLLEGLNDTSIYLPLTIKQGENNIALVRVPVIVSSIDYVQAIYENVNQEKLLEYSLMTPEELIENNIYKEVDAGSVETLLKQEIDEDFIGIKACTGATHKLEYYPIDNTVGASSSEIIKNINIYQDENGKIVGDISLNHLAGKDEGNFLYLPLKYTITSATSTASQVFYYLLKVNADTTIKDSIYAYDGSEEHRVQTLNTQGEINFEEFFDEKTLHNNEKRFNVEKNGYDDLSSKNEIVSVTIDNDDPITNENEWRNYIQISFTNNYNIMTYKPLISNKITLLIKHTYPGGTGDDVLSVLGGEQYYTIVLNENLINYSVRYKLNEESTNANNFEWNFNNYDFVERYAEATEFDANETYYQKDQDGIYFEPVENPIEEDIENYYVKLKQKSLYINLIENAQAGSAESGTVVYNVMNVGLSYGDIDQDIKGFEYDPATGEFKVDLMDYLDTDRKVEFAVYTKYGYLGTLTLNIKANATYVLKQTEIQGGEATNLTDLFDIKRDGQYTSYVKATEYRSIQYYEYDSENDRYIPVDIESEDFSEYYIFTNDTYVKATIYEENQTYYTYDSENEEYIEIAAGTITEENFSIYYFFDKDFYIFDIRVTNGMESFVDFYGTLDYGYGLIKVSDLIEDKTIELEIKVVFEGNYLYTFTQEFTLKANITPISQINSGTNIIAGENLEIDLNDLFINNNMQDGDTYGDYNLRFSEISISATSSSPAFAGLDENGKTIKTTYVSEMVTVNLNITATISTFDEDVVQTYNLTYTFNVYPSVQIIANYPNPTKEGQLTEEYIKNGSTFANILEDFIGNSAIFSEESRFDILKASKENDTISYNTAVDVKNEETFDSENFSILITEMQNVDIFTEVEEGDDIHYKANETIGSNSSVTFKRGKWNPTSGTQNDSGIESKIVLTVTYQKVSQSYTIYVEDNILSLELNMATNNIDSQDEITYEKIFVDKTKTTDLYARERMASITLREGASAYEDNYYFVFKDSEDSYYVSYPIYISANDAGKTLTIDLGYSFAGKTFVGLYRTEAVDDANSGISIAASDGKITGDITNLTNYKDNVFASPIKTLNRVQLVYQGIAVDYSYFESALAELEDVSSTENINDADTLPTFEIDNGSDDIIKEFTLQYYYMFTIDVDVLGKASQAGNYYVLSVNREAESIIDMFDIIHPTTGRNLEKADFNRSDATIGMEIVGSLDSTLSEHYPAMSQETAQKVYLRYTALLTNNQKAYDFNLLPLGAKNNGDYQAIEITYTSGIFTKTFYVVVKIMPDYIVKFGGSTANAKTEDDGNIISNENIDVIVTGQTSTQFTLVGNNGYLSIKHQNGNNTSAELSATAFDVVLGNEETIDSQTYNIEENVSSKFGNNPNVEGQISVNGVVFANQYYFVEGEDVYGYKFRLYFMLQSQNSTPSTTEEVYEITEKTEFELASMFELLTITANNDGTLTISSNDAHPEASGNGITLIELQGIKAWLFDRDYATSEDLPNYLTTKQGGGYEPAKYGEGENDKYIIPSTDDRKYLEISNMTLAHTTIDSIKLFDKDNNELQTILQEGTNHLITSQPDDENVFNGLPPNGDSRFTLPRIKNTDVYGEGNVADVTMIVRLKYTKDGNTEYFDCPVQLKVTKEISIKENPIVAVDGDEVEVANGFTINVTNTTVTNTTYINDTLDVLADPYNTARFNLTLKRGGEIIKEAFVSVSNSGIGYKRTYYISLSKYFGINVKAGDEIEISNKQNCALYYNNVIREGSNPTFTVAIITNDTIYIDNANMLANSPYYITRKYYIANCTIDEYDYAYRVTKNYYVTGKYYSMTPGSPQEIYNVLNDKETNGGITTFAEWSSAFNFNLLDVSSDEMSTRFTTPSTDYLKFVIDSESSGSGNAEIDENGNITLLNNWNPQQYITIIVKMKVSGNDRKISEDDNAGYVTLATIRLGEEPTQP